VLTDNIHIMSNNRNRRSQRSGPKRRPKKVGALEQRANIYGNAYGQLKRDIGWLMSVVNVEYKYIDTLFNANVMTNGIGSQSLLNGCATGNTAVTRTGQSTKMYRLSVNLIVHVGVTTPVNCRALIFIDKAVNGATTAVGSVFQSAVTGSDYTTACANVATVGSRIVFIHDETFSLNTANDLQLPIKMVIPLNMHTKYNTGSAGTVADISENALYLCMMSNAGATQPDFTGSVRFEYTDN